MLVLILLFVAGISLHADVLASGPPMPVEQSAEVRTGNYRGVDLVFEVIDGVAIFEGDIILGPADQMEPARGGKGRARQALAITGDRYRWPGGVVPYTTVAALAGDGRIAAAVQHWNTMLAGAIQLVPRTNQANYVQFTRPTDPARCSSSVGMQGFGVQYVNLGDYCGTGNTVHEIGHAIGLWHEQGREDRNSYVRILTENIKSTALYNFNQQIWNGDDVGAYDYGSIMHYGAYAFSANGLPTIETIPPGIPIGQRSGLSPRDIEGVRLMYAGSTPAPAPVPTACEAVTLTAYNLNATSHRAMSFYVGVFAASTCNWTAQSNADWITVKQSVLNGNGYVTLKLKANATGAPRYGTVAIGNKTVFVYQAS